MRLDPRLSAGLQAPKLVIREIHVRGLLQGRAVRSCARLPLLPPGVADQQRIVLSEPREPKPQTGMSLARGDCDEQTLSVHHSAAEDGVVHPPSDLLGARDLRTNDLHPVDELYGFIIQPVCHVQLGEVLGYAAWVVGVAVRALLQLLVDLSDCLA